MASEGQWEVVGKNGKKLSATEAKKNKGKVELPKTEIISKLIYCVSVCAERKRRSATILSTPRIQRNTAELLTLGQQNRSLTQNSFSNHCFRTKKYLL